MALPNQKNWPASTRLGVCIMPIIKPLVSRRTLAEIISNKFFPVSPRQISTWSELKYRYIGREAMYDSAEGCAAAERRMMSAPLIAQGRSVTGGSNDIK